MYFHIFSNNHRVVTDGKATCNNFDISLPNDQVSENYPWFVSLASVHNSKQNCAVFLCKVEITVFSKFTHTVYVYEESIRNDLSIIF